MQVTLALYKGPPRKGDWLHLLSHLGIRLWTWSKWSHAELVIDGVCWSASARDGGVRQKSINLDSGRWDLVSLPLTDEETGRAFGWFLTHEGEGYDYLNIARFIFAFLGQDRNKWVCFEAIGSALGLAGTHKLTANDIFSWAAMRQIEAMPYGATDD